MQALLLRNVWFRYGFKGDYVLRGVNLSLGRGELAVVTGCNGSGKTTLLKVIAGLLKPERGEVLINGVNVAGNPGKASALVGMAFQNPMHQFSFHTVLEEVREPLRLRGVGDDEAMSKALSMLRRFNLIKLSSRSPHTLSAGESRLLTIASAITHNPKVLLLDEPFTGLDVVQVEAVAEAIEGLRDSGVAVVVTSSRRDLSLTCALLNPGKVFIMRGGVLNCLKA